MFTARTNEAKSLKLVIGVIPSRVERGRLPGIPEFVQHSEAIQLGASSFLHPVRESGRDPSPMFKITQ
jgi:hypothetical protein